MADDKYAARELRIRLRDVLNTTWDPIGDCPLDEYDAYAGKIALLVRERASDNVLRDYLRWAEAEHMGLGEPNAGRLDRTLTAIRALGPVP
jgi:hypothetical protein